MSKEQAEKVIENFKSLNLKEALLKEHISAKTFYALLDEFEVLKETYLSVVATKRKNKKSRGKKVLEKETVDEIKEKYNKGESIESLSREYKTSPLVIKRHFANLGVSMRGIKELNELQRSRMCPIKSDEDWLSLYERYKVTRSLSKTCSEFGTTYKQARLNFNRLGLPLLKSANTSTFNTKQGVKEFQDVEYWKDVYSYYTTHSVGDTEKYCGILRRRLFHLFNLKGWKVRDRKEEWLFRDYNIGLKSITDAFNSLSEYELLDDFKGYTKDGKFLQYRIRHKKCGKVFSRTLHDLKSLKCVHCYPKSKNENWIADVLSEHVVTERGSRQVIPPQEIDVFVPSLNIGVEYNGRYWHNTTVVPKNYHKDKTERCLINGVTLYHFWEGQDRAIIESRLLQILGKSEKIYARKTMAREVGLDERRDFFNKCHLSGDVASSFAYGLFLDGELVSCISMRKHREGLEIARYANKLGTTVVGGFSKLMRAVEERARREGVKKIITYCNRDWTANYKDSVYYKNNFTFRGDSGPILSYYNSTLGITESREKYQKSKLYRMFSDYSGENVDSFLNGKGILKMYNSGNWKFEKEI